MDSDAFQIIFELHKSKKMKSAFSWMPILQSVCSIQQKYVFHAVRISEEEHSYFVAKSAKHMRGLSRFYDK